MHTIRFPLILTLAIPAVAGCQQSDQAQNDAAPTPFAAPAPAETAEFVAIDTTRYILSADLLERI